MRPDTRRRYELAYHALQNALDQVEDETPQLADERAFVESLAVAAYHARKGWYESR
jgi:hypothetical protein